ncbi:ABC transporter permease [Pseudoruegeria sp. SHC-113]|uniref:ABC transporter permease n=1 Tax=Pseudoruegeria sp. SHC-113 TaxID=2855439 RepID=UPI0021BAC24B|nr:ABC transporter permease subunit [Pseudoruegeria sp. SHC-113]MCT8159790.1 ABC transporter permease subunit [Pseudoruegeria sp. SHC-113]
MSCIETIQAYALRSVGIGERLLPRDYTLCEHFTLIGSGMIWNVYYGAMALVLGFFFANALALGKAAQSKWLRKPAEWFIFLFRGSPLFIQFFFAYFLFLQLKQVHPMFSGLTAAGLGALIVLFCNTAAYSGEIFYGALRSIPKGDVEAADAYGITGFQRFRRIIWPTMLRLAWPAYTNEAIFLFHATTLVFVSAFPVLQQRGDSLYYASYFADKTFNPFVPYPILAMYFILFTLVIVWLFGMVNKRLNRHLPQTQRRKVRYRPNLLR